MDLKLYNYLRIQDEKNIEFENVNLLNDEKIFVNTYCIEYNTDKYSVSINETVSMFMSSMMDFIRMGDIEQVEYCFSGIKESSEFNTGYCVTDTGGRGSGSKIKNRLLDEIKTSAIIFRLGYADFTNLDLFIPGFSNDRISDFVFSIAKHDFITFTEDMCKKYKITKVKKFTFEVYDVSSNSWVNRSYKVPYRNDKPILFAPKNLMKREGSSNNVACLYRFLISNYIRKDKGLTKDIVGTGTNGKILCKDVQAFYKCDKRFLHEMSLRYPFLIDDFKINKIKPKL